MLFVINIVLLLLCGGLIFHNTYNSSQDSNASATNTSFHKFQYLYLAVYLCMTFSDWLQGAYVYVLYESYGYGIDMISKLFIFGFFSSMIFGTIVGSLSDKLGRRKICLVFVIFYIYSCLSKHSSNLWILISGRLTGGIATSILYSSFESWMIYQHNDQKFDPSWIGDTFYKQTFANGIIAILSGYASNFLYDYFGQSAVAPFDCAIIFLTIGGALILFYWNENYGDTSGDWKKNFMKGYELMKSDRKVLCVAISQSFFEASMYIFVLMWTPTLKKAWELNGLNVSENGNLDIGYVFAAFMISVMIGSLIFKAVYSSSKDKSNLYNSVEFILLAVFGLGMISFIIPIFSDSFLLIISSFLVFEACVGLFWPAISTMKSMYIPEDVRSTVMNYIRIPTNLIVVISLLFVDYIPQFHVCCGLVLISIISQSILYTNTIEENKRNAETV